MVNAGLSITWKPAAFHLDFLRRPQPFRPAPLTALRSRHSQSSPACHGRMERCNQSQLKAAPQIQSRPDLVNVTSPLVCLQKICPDNKRAAVAKLHMSHLQFSAFIADDCPIFRPVELEGFTWFKGQRNERPTSRGL